MTFVKELRIPLQEFPSHLALSCCCMLTTYSCTAPFEMNLMFWIFKETSMPSQTGSTLSRQKVTLCRRIIRGESILQSSRFTLNPKLNPRLYHHDQLIPFAKTLSYQSSFFVNAVPLCHVVQSPQVVYLVLNLMCGTVSIKILKSNYLFAYLLCYLTN